MRATKASPRQMMAAAGVVACLLLALFLYEVVGDGPGGGTPAQASDCGNATTFFANEVANHNFGPAAPEELNAAKAELHRRRCLDPALVTAHEVYQARSYGTPADRLARTNVLADGNIRKAAVEKLEAREAKAASVEVVIMEGSYQTLYMVPGNPPEIFAGEAGAPRFAVLRFTYADGTPQDNYKLSCGYQPVEKEFPGVPGKPRPPEQPTPTPTPTGTLPPKLCPQSGCTPADAGGGRRPGVPDNPEVHPIPPPAPVAPGPAPSVAPRPVPTETGAAPTGRK